MTEATHQRPTLVDRPSREVIDDAYAAATEVGAPTGTANRGSQR